MVQLKARAAVLGISFLFSTAIPFIVQDKPRIKWVLDKAGPRIVDIAKDRIDDRTEKR